MSLRIAVLLLAILLPSFVTAQPTPNSSVEIQLRIGSDKSKGGTKLSRSRLGLDNTVAVSSFRIMKRPARFMRRVQFSETHIAVEGLDKKDNVIFQDSLIDPRLIRHEPTKNGKFLGRTDYYRASANLHVVLPHDPRIVTLRLSAPLWNGVYFDLKPMAIVPMRKL